MASYVDDYPQTIIPVKLSFGDHLSSILRQKLHWNLHQILTARLQEDLLEENSMARWLFTAIPSIDHFLNPLFAIPDETRPTKIPNMSTFPTKTRLPGGV